MTNEIKFILIILLQISGAVFGQNNYIKIQGVISDSKTNAKLMNTHIILKSKHSGTVSDANGRFAIFTDKLPETLTVSNIGYQTKRVLLKKADSNLFIYIRLIPDTITLQEAVIKGNKNIYNSRIDDYTILDYTFVDSNILILQSKLGFRKAKSLSLLTPDFDTICSTSKIPKESISIFKDCLGNAHLLTSDSAYQIWFHKKGISLLKPVEISRFYSILKNCLLVKHGNYFFKKSMIADLGEEIYYINEKTRKHQLLIKSMDSMRYEHYVNDVLHIEGMYSGYNIPICAVENDSLLMVNINKFEVEERFLREFIYRPINNKFADLNDTLVYFNHINSEITFFNSELIPTKHIPISYHKSKKWKNKIIKDFITNKAYTLFYDSGCFKLYEVVYNTGKIKMAAKISAFSTYKIKVNNGYVYYLSKSLQKESAPKKLHKKMIKFVN